MHTCRLRKYIEGKGKEGRRERTAKTRTKNKDGERERKGRKEEEQQIQSINQSIYKHSLLTSITTNKNHKKIKTNILLRMT